MNLDLEEKFYELGDAFRLLDKINSARKHFGALLNYLMSVARSW
jgi:hypothetical protein